MIRCCAPHPHFNRGGSINSDDQGCPHIERVVTISITAEAFAVIAATLPDGREADRRPDGKGGYFITLPQGVVDRLNYLRGPGQSYSDVILAMATAE
jgi:hypothetical protein